MAVSLRLVRRVSLKRGISKRFQAASMMTPAIAGSGRWRVRPGAAMRAAATRTAVMTCAKGVCAPLS